MPQSISRRRFLENSVLGGLASRVAKEFLPADWTGIFAESDEPGIQLKVVGNESEGYGVELAHGSEVIARHNSGGELSAVFQNGDRSLEDRIENWRARSWRGDANHVTLLGNCELPNSKVTVYVEVQYDLVSPKVVRKRIRFRQSDLFLLFFQVTNQLEPLTLPSKFWSFDQPTCSGGSLHEYFPAAGFVTKSRLCVGLLTDSGFRNHWSRIIRRDGKPVKPAPREIPDASLYLVPTAAEREKKAFFIRQTFGEMLQSRESDQQAQRIPLPEPSHWRAQAHTPVQITGTVIAINTSSSQDGLQIPFLAEAGAVFAIEFEYRSQVPIAIQIWDEDEHQERLQEFTLYNDTIPASGVGWMHFRTRVYIPSWKGVSGAIYISLPESQQGTETGPSPGTQKIELRGLELRRLADRRLPYHRLEMDQPIERTVFLFVDDHVPDTLRGYRMASQFHLAEGLGFQGGETEKILYSDLMMLCWNADTEEMRPMLAPSIWYSAAGEMYLRDSFYALNGVHNRELNEGVFKLWGENQGEEGAINTLVEPNMANVERKSNDSTPLWLIWALQNRRRFGTDLPAEKIRKAADYCLRTYDQRHDGTCWAQFVMGQLDVINYPQGTSDVCENQGILAVTLRVIKELDIPGISEAISEDYIQKVEAQYRGYYNPTQNFLEPVRGIADAIGFAELFPEFLSLWLFGRKLLTDEMVVNHLNRIPAMLPRADSPFSETNGTLRPIFIGLPETGGWSYFTEKWHPMISDEHAASYARHIMDGVYYNGGSWMRIEICGYVAGLLHGWSKAKKAIANRLWAEINIAQDFPTSQEYLATSTANPFFGYHRVFAWNSFVLQALELAGMRAPEMDPDYRKANSR